MSQGFRLFHLIVPCLLQGSFLWGKVYQANGIKIGEATQDSAIIWTRLTKNPSANTNGEKFPKVSKEAAQIPKGKTLEDMEGAVPGAKGKVKITWSTKGEKSNHTGWLPVDPEKDYTRKVEITNLLPGNFYEIKVQSQSIEGVPGETVSGKFRTAPAPDQQSAVKFVVSTCQDYPRKDTPMGHQIYPRMLELDPDFFVHTGDIEYYDKPQPWANNQTLCLLYTSPSPRD